MRTFVIFVLLSTIAIGQVSAPTTRVAELVESITPVEPRLSGKGYEHLKYKLRMPKNRHDAMVELGTLGNDAAAAVPLLSKLINDQYEPPHCRLAMIETLEKIGPASKAAIPSLKQVIASNKSNGQQKETKDAFLSIAAERAILFIELKSEDQLLQISLVDLYPLLQKLFATEEKQIVRLVHNYYCNKDSQSPDYFVGQFLSVVPESKRQVRLISQLMSDRRGKVLGNTLLNSSLVEGKSIVKQLIEDAQSTNVVSTLLGNLDDGEAFAKHLLEDSALSEQAWERVFTIFKTNVINGEVSGKKERLAEMVLWLRGCSNLPGRRSTLVLDWLFETDMMMAHTGDQQKGMVDAAIWIREISDLKRDHRLLAYNWLFNTWTTSGVSEQVQLEVVETARRLVDSITSKDGLILLNEWPSQTAARMRFAVQLLPDFRVSQADREKEAQQLIALTKNAAFNPLATERKLIHLIRMKPPTSPASPVPFAESFLHEGRFVEGVAALQVVLNANPADDQDRFGLGVLQFVSAIENLGKAFYKYGAVSESSRLPFLRIPVPRNESPTAISYEDFGEVLDAFENDLMRAEATLAMIRDDNVKLQLRLAKISFDFRGTGEDQTNLLDILSKLNAGQPSFAFANPELQVHFDRGDVAWLRAYCHLLSAFVDCYRALNLEPMFAQAMADVFPEVMSRPELMNQPAITSIESVQPRIVDAPRLRSMRLHLLMVCQLNPETWMYIRKELDDDYEWLAHPMQTDQLMLPLTNPMIDSWLDMMEQLEGLLKGERLIPGVWIRLVNPHHTEEGRGLNLQKLLDDPPLDLFSQNRISGMALDDKYLDTMTDRNTLDGNAFLLIFQLFRGPFGFAQAARLN